MSKATLSVGKITHVSWPPMDKPPTGYPSMFRSFAFFEEECEPRISLAEFDSSVPGSMISN